MLGELLRLSSLDRVGAGLECLSAMLREQLQSSLAGPTHTYATDVEAIPGYFVNTGGWKVQPEKDTLAAHLRGFGSGERAVYIIGGRFW